MEWPPGITARPIAERDLEFLCRLYGSTRMDELALTDWTAETKEAFVKHQFEAQHHHYQTHYKAAEFWLLEKNGEAIGRLYVDHWPREIRLVDIALVPEVRGQGLGRALLMALIEEGWSAGKPVSIHVEMFNPAMRLYERLGFVAIGDHGPYKLMQWSPSDRPAGTPAATATAGTGAGRFT